jgi:hypothetical protein
LKKRDISCKSEVKRETLSVTVSFCFDISPGGLMILRLTCPQCSKDSYSASVEKFKPCPYCGVLFSAKYGFEKRKHFRVKKEIPLAFTHQGQKLQACTMDVSDRGMCVKISGSHSFPAVGETVDVHVNDANLKAQVMWFSNDKKDSSVITGLQIPD